MIIENVFHKTGYTTARLFYCTDASLQFGVSKICFIVLFFKIHFIQQKIHLIDQKYQ